MIQDLEFFTAGVLDLKQSQLAAKQPPIFNRGNGAGFKDRDASARKNQILNHEVYKWIL